jgi:hypothetical protein
VIAGWFDVRAPTRGVTIYRRLWMPIVSFRIRAAARVRNKIKPRALNLNNERSIGIDTSSFMSGVPFAM